MDISRVLRSDIVVVGGGPAGSTTALALSRAGWDTVVVDVERRGRSFISESLPSVARPWLENLGIFSEFEASGYRNTVANCSYWGSNVPRERPSLLVPYGDGWLVGRQHFDASLKNAASSHGARYMQGVVTSISRQQNQWKLCVGGSEQHTIITRGLVDATGRAATVARRLGAKVRLEARLVAACSEGTLDAHNDRDNVILIEAARDGWWYSAPLERHHSLVFFTLPTLLRSHPTLSRALEGAPRTRERIGDASTSLRVVAAHAAITQPCAGTGWIAVGDAANAQDPLASAGLITALRGGLRAAEAVASCLGGDAAAIEQYAKMQEAAFHRHLQDRARLYRMERRWTDSAFWLAQQTSSGVGIPV